MIGSPATVRTAVPGVAPAVPIAVAAAGLASRCGAPAPSRSAAEWDESFDPFHASGPTRRRFCEQHGPSRDAFRNRYRVSPKFRGQQRRPPRAGRRRVAARATAPPWRTRR